MARTIRFRLLLNRCISVADAIPTSSATSASVNLDGLVRNMTRSAPSSTAASLMVLRRGMGSFYK